MTEQEKLGSKGNQRGSAAINHRSSGFGKPRSDADIRLQHQHQQQKQQQESPNGPLIRAISHCYAPLMRLTAWHHLPPISV
ncbi:Hypothetical protein NTJ_01612 [Nesidiocoris tenuis]|uniref:Uncharacterized protein n=1 Tax=Nesidiocoris tenuis TaxID=355587 RepID=A0ABN7A9B4_9HEMI|nr:Hypothetical protein NTJ_01612 [Nesidiocoris tenuis]